MDSDSYSCEDSLFSCNCARPVPDKVFAFHQSLLVFLLDLDLDLPFLERFLFDLDLIFLERDFTDLDLLFLGGFADLDLLGDPKPLMIPG